MILHTDILSTVNHRKRSLWERIFDNMALYFECRINKKKMLL